MHGCYIRLFLARWNYCNVDKPILQIIRKCCAGRQQSWQWKVYWILALVQWFAVVILYFKSITVTDKSSLVRRHTFQMNEIWANKPINVSPYYCIVGTVRRVECDQLLGNALPKLYYLYAFHWIYGTRTGIIETLLCHLTLLRGDDYRITGTTGNETAVYLNCLSKTPC